MSRQTARSTLLCPLMQLCYLVCKR